MNKINFLPLLHTELKLYIAHFAYAPNVLGITKFSPNRVSLEFPNKNTTVAIEYICTGQYLYRRFDNYKLTTSKVFEFYDDLIYTAKIDINEQLSDYEYYA